MTAQDRRKAVAAKYATLIGRNIYSQSLRDYCFKKYKDGNYYSDCSSSICYTYKEAGEGFGILNTAGIYQSSKLTTVAEPIINGVPDVYCLRVGDMLEFAGTDASRPLKIGHVEMVYSIDGDSAIICGHGSGRPSYKDMAAYCRQRYNSWASGGWRKELVCVRRYIQDDAAPEEAPKLSGWQQEADGWRFYLGNTGECVKNACRILPLTYHIRTEFSFLLCCYFFACCCSGARLKLLSAPRCREAGRADGGNEFSNTRFPSYRTKISRPSTYFALRCSGPDR